MNLLFFATFLLAVTTSYIRIIHTDGKPIIMHGRETTQITPSENIEEKIIDAEKLLEKINNERITKNIPPVEMKKNLYLIARAHGVDMARRGYFSHISPEGIDPFHRMDQAKIIYQYAGENIALDQSVEEADQALWNSPGHRSNTLDKHYRHVGIAAIISHDGEIFVEEFTN